MLTKSLHTITAATNVAKRELFYPAPRLYTAEGLARTVLAVLGYDIDTNIKGDPTVDRIVENCRALIAAKKGERDAA